VFLKNLIVGCILLPLACSATSTDALPSGVMEGHLKVLSRKPFELGNEGAPAVAAENYADYPLLILSRDSQKEIARITADRNGDYRAVLPPGEYVLVAQNRARKHMSAKPQRFTVVSNQTVRVDMQIDTDHWRVRSPQSVRPALFGASRPRYFSRSSSSRETAARSFPRTTTW
jgi:hypothetical protein